MTFRETRRSAPSVTHTPLSGDRYGKCSPVLDVSGHASEDLLMSSKSGRFGFFPRCSVLHDLSGSSIGRGGSGAMDNLLTGFILLSSSEFHLSSFQGLFSSHPDAVSRVHLILVGLNDSLLSSAQFLSFSSSSLVLHQLCFGSFDNSGSGSVSGLFSSENGVRILVGFLGQGMGVSGGVPLSSLSLFDTTESLHLSFGNDMGSLGYLQGLCGFLGSGLALDVDGEVSEVDLGFGVTFL